MTASISEAFDGLVTQPLPVAAPERPKPAPEQATKPQPAAVPVEEVDTGPSLADRAQSAAATVAADARTAWWWYGRPQTLAERWAARIPDRDTVPDGNGALFAGWVVFNHLALIVAAVLYTPLWVLQHPGYFLLTAVVAVPLLAVLL